MSQRICKKCGFIGEMELDFPTRSNGYYRYSCKECWKKYQNSRYDEGKSNHYRRDFRNKSRKFVYDYLLTHSCVDCGESTPCCLDFDHVKGEKYKTIRDMIAGCYSINNIKIEIEKCEVRCANCHRKKTAKDFDWYKDLK